MPGEAAHARWWQIFEVVVGAPFLAALLLQRVVPLALPRGFLTPAVAPLGAGLIVAGVALVALARRELARRDQPTDPGRATSELVTTGVYALSRNPLYLGGSCILAGIALAFDLPWALVLLAPALVACRLALIGPEERYLAATVGEEYRAYAAVVRRWLGRRGRPVGRGFSKACGVC
jgi:protein-S-isoprenylcysteine O-methyltransferase Ste14